MYESKMETGRQKRDIQVKSSLAQFFVFLCFQQANKTSSQFEANPGSQTLTLFACFDLKKVVGECWSLSSSKE